MAVRAQKRSSNLHILASNSITPSNFEEFGTVIENSGTSDKRSQEANQGTATKWIDVSYLDNWYEKKSSGGRDEEEARVVMNMFVCRPRTLRDGKYFDVRILERHPYTSQTFIPMGVGKEDKDVRYLVIVAPTLREEGTRPPTNPSTLPTPSWRTPQGPGEPDLKHLKAFIVRGDQAVTYGPGTWHAPMVVLGEKEIEFVVVQYANGVALDDCQEIDVLPEQEEGGEGLCVEVRSESDDASNGEAHKPGYMRAKL